MFQVLCANLLDTALQYITSGVREHQQVKISTVGTVVELEILTGHQEHEK